MLPKQRNLFLLVPLLLTLLPFQNCGKFDLHPEEESVLNQSSLKCNPKTDLCSVNDSCQISNGVGFLQQLASGELVCIASQCQSGYRPSGERCIAWAGTCSVVNGYGEVDGTGKCRATGCVNGWHLDQNACEPDVIACDITNGIGKKIWQGSQYSGCQVLSCNTGFRMENNQCLANAQSCPVPNGNGQVVDGSCRVTTCNTGYRIENNQCISNTQVCVIKNGQGIRTWNGSSYSNCKVDSCNTGYRVYQNTCAIVPPNPAYQSEDGTLRKKGDRRNKKIGVGLANNPLRSENLYFTHAYREFNYITPENSMKWTMLQPQQGKFDFSWGDELVEFAMKYNMKVHGHTLAWYKAFPNWLKNGQFTNTQKMSILKDHIQTVVGHYRQKYPGQVVAWDVVNEPIHDFNGGIRPSIWSQAGATPEEYIEKAFRWAHEADPSALLYINDYSVESASTKGIALFNLVRRLKQKGVPIHGVGFQTHLSTEYNPPPVADMRQMIQRYQSIGVKVFFSEMDVRINREGGITNQELQTSQIGYRNVIAACNAEPNCIGVTIWGLTEKYSWIVNEWPTFLPSLPFSDTFQKNSIYQTIFNSL